MGLIELVWVEWFEVEGVLSSTVLSCMDSSSIGLSSTGWSSIGLSSMDFRSNGLK